MALLGKITVYVLFLNLFLSRNNWNKYARFAVFVLFFSTLASASSGSLLENVEQVKSMNIISKCWGILPRARERVLLPEINIGESIYCALVLIAQNIC